MIRHKKDDGEKQSKYFNSHGCINHIHQTDFSDKTQKENRIYHGAINYHVSQGYLLHLSGRYNGRCIWHKIRGSQSYRTDDVNGVHCFSHFSWPTGAKRICLTRMHVFLLLYLRLALDHLFHDIALASPNGLRGHPSEVAARQSAISSLRCLLGSGPIHVNVPALMMDDGKNMDKWRTTAP